MTTGLGWIAGDVVADRAVRPGAEDPAYGLEHARRAQRPHPLLAGIPTGPDGLHAYFVHSYHLHADGSGRRRRARPTTAAPVTAIVGRDNIAGTQFHPEKSQKLGLP